MSDSMREVTTAAERTRSSEVRIPSGELEQLQSDLAAALMAFGAAREVAAEATEKMARYEAALYEIVERGSRRKLDDAFADRYEGIAKRALGLES